MKTPAKKLNAIKLPENFETPPDLADGDSFEAVVKIKKDGDTYCLTHLDGMPMADEKDVEEAESMPDDEAAEGESVGKRVMSKMK